MTNADDVPIAHDLCVPYVTSAGGGLPVQSDAPVAPGGVPNADDVPIARDDLPVLDDALSVRR